ncbi:uncharacterized protein LOC133530372 [Cydia pomonella]|uniref:uncharacterized protein LOC133530372 n=1 Tax=Cydia pomonella TaxID=82600 RepID=UPI002ADD9B52|nr:uncharacterized protein LOC133530372 [Cydia pomonella]
MKLLTISMIIFGAIATKEASIVPNKKDIYVLDQPTSNNIYISLLPMETVSKNTEKLPKEEFDILRQQMKEIMKRMCGQDVKSGEMDSDVYTCAIKTVTFFIGCIHMDTDNLKDTVEADPFIKCLSQAVSVFVKCVISNPSSAVLDNYASDVVIHMK